MKKLLAILMAITLLIGCGSTDGESDEKVKVLLMVGQLGDFSFFDSAYEGMMRVKEDFADKVEVEVIEFGNGADKEEPAFFEGAESDADIVIFPAGIGIYLDKYSGEYDDKNFIIFDNEVDYTDGKNKNVYSVKYKANEASFLGGYMASELSDTGILGFIGGQDVPVITDFLVGFVQGAQESNKDIKVATSYVGAWNDSAGGKEQAFAMINQNVSLLFGVAGGSGAGVIEAGAERNIPILGVDSDQSLVYKDQGKNDLADIIITSVLKNVGDSLYRAVELHLDGKLPYGEVEELGLAENGVGLADNEYFQKYVSEDLIAKIKELEEKVSSGEIKVKSGFGMAPEELNEIRNSVKP